MNKDDFAKEKQWKIEEEVKRYLNIGIKPTVEFNRQVILNSKGLRVLSGTGKVLRVLNNKSYLEIEVVSIFEHCHYIQKELLQYFPGHLFFFPILRSGRCNFNNYLEKILV